MTSSSFVIRGAADLADRGREVGGKAANLARAMGAGHAVPPFYVVTADAFQRVLQTSAAAILFDQLASLPATTDIASRQSVAAALRAAVVDLALPPELVQELRMCHHALFGAEPHAPVAVRSSAIAEDGDRHSFAGMHDSELGVVGVDRVVDAIKRIWASSFSDRAIAYRLKWRLPTERAPMAVVVQRLIVAEWSGVLFTRDPLDPQADHVVINAAPGSGEALVQGGAAGRSFRIDRRALTITPTQPTDDGSASDWSPPRDQMREAAAAGLALEETLGRPQDVEFAFGVDGQLAILQTRPITAAAPPPRDAARRVIWDNSNIIESYPGVTSPMTFSFIRRAYARVYRCFSEVMGIPPHVVRANQDAFDNMLGLFRGRVYYNLTNWHRLVQLFPGYRYNREFMESMMGVKEAAHVAGEPSPPRFWRRWLVDLPALIGLLGRSAWNFLRIRSLVDRFDRDFERRYHEWSRIDFTALAPDELMTLCGQMEAEMFAKWKTPIINDFFVMVFYGLLRKLCAAWCGDESGSLQNGLLCGDGQLASAEPVRQILQLVQMAHGQPALKQLILAGPVVDLPQRVADDPRFVEFSERMDAYLDQYGLRCVEELKLESPTYRDRPHLVYQLIQSYLSMEACSWQEVSDRRQRERRMRTENERQAMQLMAQAGRGRIQRRLFRWVLENTRLGVRNREKMRLARTRIFDVFRSMLRSIGTRFERDGVLDSAHDIFYLTVDEMWDYVRGAAVTTDVRALATLRRRQYAAYADAAAAPPPRRFETFGVPYRDSVWESEPRGHVEPAVPQLRGLGGCPGVVTGIVEVVRDPREARFNGDIMVAEQTDPGWTTLYPAYSGLLIERGSVLSHSMIVAREFGIPTIVGVEGLTRRLHSGDRVRMDGRTGSIEILAGPAATKPERHDRPLASVATA